LVDLFIAPSQFLLERYVDWGIPRERIVFEEYGRLPLTEPVAEPPQRARHRFGFFGQFNPYKGADVVLQAMAILNKAATAASSSEGGSVDARLPDETPHLWIHGANLDLQEGTFQNRFHELVEQAGDSVTLVGRYDHRDLPALMDNIDWVIVPSIWWENSPLVIQEAFMYRRPVICSDIGGMAEKVRDGTDGLHFRAGDPSDLAETITRAVTDPELWSRLRSNIQPIYPMADHLRVLYRWYDGLRARRIAESVA
jgi:glycosyltransferase involved in cell wall biosynthesis